jgi:hypothetical protein
LLKYIVIQYGDKPFGVAVLLDVEFALSKGIPKLDRPVARPRDDLPVVRTEADRQNVRGVADESTSGCAGVQVPQAKSVIPRRRKGELAVRRNNNVGYEVVMAVKNSFRVTIRVIVASKLPDDDGLVCA